MDNLTPIGPPFRKAKEPEKARSNAWDMAPRSNAFSISNDTSLFSSSLPVLWHEKLNLMNSERGAHFVDDTCSKMKNSSDDVESSTSLNDVNCLLPDDEEELLAGITDELDLTGLPGQLEELEEYDLFGSLGGLELDSDPKDNIAFGLARANIPEGYFGNGITQYNLPNGVATVAGEHPYGEHPSRTLFVRNINSNVEDSELQALFEQYGDIRSLYTQCKHRGFVMISYYDIRSARNAMRALQNKPVRRRKLDIHFSIPKDNPSDKDMNQGTLVIFNLDPSVTNEDLRQIFGAYGEVKEIRETPHKRHHKFIEFYDVRDAEAALKSLNKIDIAGKRIKLEPSRPGGARRNLIQQLNHDFEPDDSRIYRQHVGSPIANSPPGTWLQFSSPSDSSSLHAAFSKSPTGVPIGSFGNNKLPDLASVISPVSGSMKISPIGKDQSKLSHFDQTFTGSSLSQGSAFQHSHSVPDHNNGVLIPSSRNLASLGASPTNASIGTLSGPQFLWGSPTTHGEHSHSSSWQSRPAGYPYKANGQVQGQGQSQYSSPHGSFVGSSYNQNRFQVGSAPSGLPFERRYGYFPESPETSFINQVAFGNSGTGRNGGGLMMNMSSRPTINPGFAVTGNVINNNLPNLRMMSSQRPLPSFLGSAPYLGVGSTGLDGFYDRSRNRRVDSNGSQFDNKHQYQLDLDKISKGEDVRTTLMIKNIPNKYTSKMLLAAIDEHHKGTYDFLYLPIDFKNKCNVGYAFINMVSPSHIISFYKVFNGKKWEKFNSEKVASLAYGRIQGKQALIAHFQNSSLMNEDKRCRPILFDAEGLETVEQDIFPSSGFSVGVNLQEDVFFADDLAGSPELSKPTESTEKSRLPGVFDD